jgi:hypothetical protein
VTNRIGGELSATLRSLAKAKAEVKDQLDKLSSRIASVERKSFELKEQRYEGDIRISFEEITGNPLKQAEADVMRADAEVKRRGGASLTAASTRLSSPLLAQSESPTSARPVPGDKNQRVAAQPDDEADDPAAGTS